MAVEDNDADAYMAKEFFSEASIDTTFSVVGCGEDALDFIRKQDPFANAPTPDLVLLDLNLPRKSGHEVLAELKGDEALRHIPVIVWSSCDGDRDVARAVDLHANAFVNKPQTLTEYRRMIRAFEDFWFGVARLRRPITAHQAGNVR